MPMIRVLVVDDSPVIRRMVAQSLATDPGLEVVGTAADGKLGLAKVAQLSPDIVILDVEMPVMDGLATLKVLRKTHPRLPVIMFSTLTQRGAAVTIEALTLGASDYAAKPANFGSAEAAMQGVREDLAPKIKRLCQRVPPRAVLAVPAASVVNRPNVMSAPAVACAAPSPVNVLTIGVSTGGPNALAMLLPLLVANFPVPVVLVQHMPPLFTRSLAERLSVLSRFRAREGEAGAVLQPGDLWVAPGGLHMEVERHVAGIKLRLHEGPPECSCRPAVDVLFRSVARVFGRGALAVVLTGMGQDGLGGSRSIQEAGGRVLAQDEATSVVWGMPGAVAQAGLAEKVLPLPALADEINRRVQHAVPRRATGSHHRVSVLTKIL